MISTEYINCLVRFVSLKAPSNTDARRGRGGGRGGHCTLATWRHGAARVPTPPRGSKGWQAVRRWINGDRNIIKFKLHKKNNIKVSQSKDGTGWMGPLFTCVVVAVFVNYKKHWKWSLNVKEPRGRSLRYWMKCRLTPIRPPPPPPPYVHLLFLFAWKIRHDWCEIILRGVWGWGWWGEGGGGGVRVERRGACNCKYLTMICYSILSSHCCLKTKGEIISQLVEQ